MDKKLVYRQFILRFSKPDSETNEVFSELVMQTLAEGPFGPVSLETGMRIDGVSIWQTMTQSAAAPADLTFALRCREMSYFVNQIVPLFNPINTIDYEVPSSSQAQDE